MRSPEVEWFSSYRSWQPPAIEEITGEFKRGVRLVILDAPTGTGKTLIGEAVRLNLDMAGLYVCTTKSLQDQMVGDYPYAALLKGRSNYLPLNPPAGFGVTCTDCTKQPRDDLSCLFCPSVRGCPYERAKARALGSRLSVLNTSYFLTETNGPGRFSGRELVVVDECDVLEREVMSYAGLDITPRRVAELGIGTPAKITKQEEWEKWVERAGERVSDRVERHDSHSENLAIIREGKRLNLLLGKLKFLGKELPTGNWIYTGKGEGVSFKPVRVAQMANGHLWRHGKRWLLMSGTVISAEEIVESLGWEDEYSVVTIPSQFQATKRPVHIRPVATVVKANGEEAEEKVAQEVNRVCSVHKGDRVLVHAVSYRLSERITDAISNGRPVFTYQNSKDREQALSSYKETPGSILVASSFDRGIDLPDELCRVIIIAKIPYPYLGDRQVSARLHGDGGQLWYTVQTIRTLIQMTGRGVRHSEDECVSYVLDGSFVKLYKGSRHLFPSWWKDALVTRGNGA